MASAIYLANPREGEGGIRTGVSKRRSYIYWRSQATGSDLFRFHPKLSKFFSGEIIIRKKSFLIKISKRLGTVRKREIKFRFDKL